MVALICETVVPFNTFFFLLQVFVEEIVLSSLVEHQTCISSDTSLWRSYSLGSVMWIKLSLSFSPVLVNFQSAMRKFLSIFTFEILSLYSGFKFLHDPQGVMKTTYFTYCSKPTAALDSLHLTWNVLVYLGWLQSAYVFTNGYTWQWLLTYLHLQNSCLITSQEHVSLLCLLKPCCQNAYKTHEIMNAFHKNLGSLLSWQFLVTQGRFQGELVWAKADFPCLHASLYPWV